MSKKMLFLFALILFYTISTKCCSIKKIPKNEQEQIVHIAKEQLGKPYVYGGHNPKKGFDCSGLVYYTFQEMDISTPRVSRDFVNFGTAVPLSEAEKGDIIIFKDTNPKKKQAGHVGIVISEKDAPLEFIHSSSSKRSNGVVITNFEERKHYQDRFMKIVRATK